MDITVRALNKFSSRIDRARLARIAERALRAEKAKGDTALTIYVTGDGEIRLLNRKFHATNAPTDVLSFPSGSGELYENPQEPAYLGDVVISYERAKEQALVAHWRIADELDLLAVHGILHLLGYDDVKPQARAKMWQRQEQILGRSLT